jgi:uncharacterized protein DUF4169
MAEIINLNKARKAKARAEKPIRAQENRARYGRTKSEKATETAEKARIDKMLDDSSLR